MTHSPLGARTTLGSWAKAGTTTPVHLKWRPSCDWAWTTALERWGGVRG